MALAAGFGGAAEGVKWPGFGLNVGVGALSAAALITGIVIEHRGVHRETKALSDFNDDADKDGCTAAPFATAAPP